MAGERSPFSVLVVCDGNVCRSPSVEFALSAMLPQLRVESAGMHARTGSRLCRVVADSIIVDEARASPFIESFRSRRLIDVDVRDFDLALAATRELRADLARAHPQLRDRFFTIREAAAVLSGSFTPDGPREVDAVVRIMNERRGSVPPFDRPAMPWKRIDPSDIPDAHRARNRLHHGVVDLALAAGARIGESLVSLDIAW